MEYFGLLGLLGLMGFFSGRNLENKINTRINNLPNNESRIAQNEKIISDLTKELERVQFVLQSCLTSNDLNNFSEQIQRELKRLEGLGKNYATISSLNELENKIYNLPKNSDLQNLKAILEEIQRRISKIDNNSPAPPVAVPNSNFENKIAQLERQISEQSRLLAQYQNYFSQMQAGINNLNQKFNEQLKINAALEQKFEEQLKTNSALEERIKNLEKTQVQPVTPTAQLVTTPKIIEQPITTPQILEIKDFQIKKTDLTLFSNNPADAEKSLKIIENVTPILSFLENSKFDKKDNFIRIVKNYRQNVQKFSDKVKNKKFDEDNFSFEVTEAFLSTLSKYFLTTLPVSIYRGNKENFKFYSEFLNKINEYLANCRVYTEFIEPKKIMNHDAIEKMNIVKKETSMKSEDKIIDEVERLPYFVNYLTEDDELENLCFDGSMVVLKFEGGTK